MFVSIDKIKLNYKRFDGEGEFVLLLHGWGANLMTMDMIFDFLKAQNKSVISVDLPYFGLSDSPPSDFGVYEYADIVEKFIKNQRLKDITILGHSFGGRLGIILSARCPLVKKLVLVDSAGVKPKRGIKYKLKVFAYKLKKLLKLNLSGSGSSDFKTLPPNMRPIFTRIVNTHLDKLLPLIKLPTLILWGRNDTDTPLYMAKRLNKKIKNSGLVILEDAGHYCFLDKRNQFNIILYAFITT